jgi:hypothetical protein
MKAFYAAVIVFFAMSGAAFSAENIYICDYKISTSAVGSARIYVDKSGSWKIIDGATVTPSLDRAIIPSRTFKVCGGQGPQCQVKTVINLIPRKSKNTEYVRLRHYAKAFCKWKQFSVFQGGECKSFNAGDLITTSYCTYVKR